MKGEKVWVNITGLEELQDKLEQLPAKLSDSIIRQALSDGADIVQAKMQDLAPEADGIDPAAPAGFLKKNINKKFGRLRTGIKGVIAATIYVGPNTKKDYPDSEGSYHKNKKGKKVGRISVYDVATILEFGAASHGTGKEGGHGGPIAARPFIRPAWYATKDQMLASIISSLKLALGL